MGIEGTEARLADANVREGSGDPRGEASRTTTADHALAHPLDQTRTTDSEAMDVPRSPREELLEVLTRALPALAAAGDHEGARIAHKALGELLTSIATVPAGVVALDAERAKRGAQRRDGVR